MTYNASEEARCATCSTELDTHLHETCEVCEGARYCVACAREHYCTDECESRGCLKGLCVKLVQDGVLARRYGIRAPG